MCGLGSKGEKDVGMAMCVKGMSSRSCLSCFSQYGIPTSLYIFCRNVFIDMLVVCGVRFCSLFLIRANTILG